MTCLLDVNVLIALIDPGHVQHNAAHQWFASHGHKDWATCPMTENGVVRIVGHPRYPNSPGSPPPVMALLARITALPGHAFWSDALSLRDAKIFDAARLLSSAQVTDSYLLALAHSHRAQLASFDRRLVTDAVRGAAKALFLID